MTDDTDVEEQTEFKFSELSDKAKQKARDTYRGHGPGYDWWDVVYEDAVTVGALIGIEINQTIEKNRKDQEYTETSINFSGFWSQGDGCCYSSTLHVEKLKDCVAALSTHVGKDEELFAIARRGEEIYEQITVRLVTARMKGTDTDDEVQLDGRIKIVGEERYFRTSVIPDVCPEDLEADLDSYVSSFADWIYSSLEAEHDHLNSDAVVDEYLDDGDEIYYEDGSAV